MGFSSIIAQERPIRILSVLLRKQRIPHALLFTGIDGIGKRTTATAFAMACNCTQERQDTAVACEACVSCRKIQSGNHPDIHRIEPKGALIRIDQIRELCGALSLKPHEARMRVVILSDAQTMNPEAGNALLKMLEEPPDRTILILTATETSDMLPTIVSRCHPIRFNPIPQHCLESFLIQQRRMEADHAALLAGMANGSLSKAISMADQMNWTDWRNRLLHAGGLDRVKHSTAGALSSSLLLSEMLAARKDTLQDSLELIKSWFRDAAVYRYLPEKILHRDRKNNIHEISQHTPVMTLLSRIQAVASVQRNIQANANARLALDVLMTSLAVR